MKIVLGLLKLIPIKKLAKYLPEILAYILTKSLTWLFKKYPEKTPKVIDKTKEVIDALTQNIDAASDGVISDKEVKTGIALWKEVL